jgi:predicted RNA-binding protein associated with RNAse of E/G family
MSSQDELYNAIETEVATRKAHEQALANLHRICAARQKTIKEFAWAKPWFEKPKEP